MTSKTTDLDGSDLGAAIIIGAMIFGVISVIVSYFFTQSDGLLWYRLIASLFVMIFSLLIAYVAATADQEIGVMFFMLFLGIVAGTSASISLFQLFF
jgi:hypothetical protein